MGSGYPALCASLRASPRTWLVTGAAGFIGSNLVEALLRLDQRVVGLDNFATGHRRNLDEVREKVGATRWQAFSFIEGDIRVPEDCRRAVGAGGGSSSGDDGGGGSHGIGDSGGGGRGGGGDGSGRVVGSGSRVDYVLHQAALGSVPRSIEAPAASHDTNVTGTLNLLIAARDAGIRRFVYASSSSVYGDEPTLPKREDRIGAPLSPYAATKWINEIYAETFARCYAMEPVGLRYFNVFGPRQDPAGAYAAVIPCWFAAMARGDAVHINGDGETSRDFCYIDNVVQANLLAATAALPAGAHVFNIAVGARTTLNELFALIRERVARERPQRADMQPVYRDFRAGDVRHSLADIGLAAQRLGYAPTHDIGQGLDLAAQWYLHGMAT